jgi:hypothetical protein
VNPECRQPGLSRLPAGQTRLKPEGDVKRLIGADGYVRCHANAFYPPALDGVVVRNRHPQVKAAGNVEQLGRQQNAGSFLADDSRATSRLQCICGDFSGADRAAAGQYEDRPWKSGCIGSMR